MIRPKLIDGKLEPTEHQIQCAFVEYVAILEPKYPMLKLSFAVPNGGKRTSAISGAILKREGVRPGVPDWWLPVPRRNFHGVVIEFKTRKGVISREQTEYLTELRCRGWIAEVCRSVDEGIDTLNSYLGII